MKNLNVPCAPINVFQVQQNWGHNLWCLFCVQVAMKNRSFAAHIFYWCLKTNGIDNNGRENNHSSVVFASCALLWRGSLSQNVVTVSCCFLYVCDHTILLWVYDIGCHEKSIAETTRIVQRGKSTFVPFLNWNYSHPPQISFAGCEKNFCTQAMKPQKHHSLLFCCRPAAMSLFCPQVTRKNEWGFGWSVKMKSQFSWGNNMNKGLHTHIHTQTHTKIHTHALLCSLVIVFFPLSIYLSLPHSAPATRKNCQCESIFNWKIKFNTFRGSVPNLWGSPEGIVLSITGSGQWFGLI